MGWSFKIGRIAGIDVYVHATFALLLLWVGYSSYSVRQDLNEALASLIFLVSLFGVIVLHELGHALTARRFGIKTRDITLLPIGGVARLERIPRDPKQELLVALAGPAVNVVLAILLFGILVATGLIARTADELIADLSSFGGSLLVRLFAANIFLAVFNLIPAFPMDGGRVLRAILAMRLDYVAATRIAAQVGQFLAVLFGIGGLLSGNPLLLVIALFVWVGATGEVNSVQFKAGVSGVPVARAMIRKFIALGPDDTLGLAAKKTLEGFQCDFPVMADGSVRGILSRTELLAGLAEAGPGGRVGEFMRTEFSTAEPDEMVEAVLERFQRGECPVMPVLSGGRVVGLLAAGNVAELVMIREAVHERELKQYNDAPHAQP